MPAFADKSERVVRGWKKNKMYISKKKLKQQKTQNQKITAQKVLIHIYIHIYIYIPRVPYLSKNFLASRSPVVRFARNSMEMNPSGPPDLSKHPGPSETTRICRSVGLSACRSVRHSVCLLVGLSVCRSVGL